MEICLQIVIIILKLFKVAQFLQAYIFNLIIIHSNINLTWLKLKSMRKKTWLNF